MNAEEQLRKSKLTKKDHRYLVIKQLPSNFRSYDTDTVYVRGLTWGEVSSLSTIASNATYTDLANIYSDAIDGVEVEELELMDFIILMEISTIWTSRKNGWVPNVRCPHVIYNEDNGNPSRCNGVITDPIVLSDLKINESEITESFIPTGIIHNNKEVIVSPIKVKNMISIENNSNKYDNETALSYAEMITNPEMTLDEKYNFVLYGEAEEIQILEKIDEELDVDVDLINKKCPSCGSNVKIKISLNELKAYP